MEEVERTNAVMTYPNQQVGFMPKWGQYAMELDRRNKNCYNCRDFEHSARNCRNKGIGDRIGEGRRLEYGQGNNR